jgi:hypothetical protein
MAKKLNIRVSVKNRLKASFRTGGQAYDNIHLLNLGVDGCRIEVPMNQLARISGDSVLESWSLIHPLLPAESIQAKVLWSHHDDMTRAGFLEAEVQFLGASVDYQTELKNYVTILAEARPECVANDLVGMP